MKWKTKSNLFVITGSTLLDFESIIIKEHDPHTHTHLSCYGS